MAEQLLKRTKQVSFITQKCKIQGGKKIKNGNKFNMFKSNI
jgi:hypothetical protein